MCPRLWMNCLGWADVVAGGAGVAADGTCVAVDGGFAGVNDDAVAEDDDDVCFGTRYTPTNDRNYCPMSNNDLIRYRWASQHL